MIEDKLNTKYPYGQKMIRKRSQEVSYIACKDAGYEYLIKMAYNWPYQPGDKIFFVHLSDLSRKYYHPSEGRQTKLF